MIVEHVKKTRLTRNRFLAIAGATLVGVASNAWFPGRAEAAPPNGCYGYNGCSCCSATSCCASGRRGALDGHNGERSARSPLCA